MKQLQKILFYGTALFALASCKPDVSNVVAPVSNESLTTTILNLQNVSDATDKPTISYKIIPPATTATVSPDSLILKKNSVYNCTITILDETKSPVDTVSKTIIERANIHLFVYRPDPNLMLTDSITDHDSNVPPLPFGIKSQIKTGAASDGNLELILRHQPNVKNGTYAPGSTDLDVTYPVKIK